MDPTPASRLQRAIPLLPVLELEAALAFYESSLGFMRQFEVDDYAGVGRDGIELHFWKCDDPTLPRNSICRLEVAGIDGLFAAARQCGIVHPNGGLEGKLWGFREFSVLDPDGNLVVHAEEIAGWCEPG